jgi:hypothetical protein
MRDLTWDGITTADKIMLPLYMGFFTVISLNFMFSNLDVLVKSPGLNYANNLMGLRAWGLIFCAVVVCMAVAVWLRHRSLFRYALILGAITMMLWMLTMLAAILTGDASASAFAWPTFIAGACVASNRSLLRGET